MTKTNGVNALLIYSSYQLLPISGLHHVASAVELFPCLLAEVLWSWLTAIRCFNNPRIVVLISRVAERYESSVTSATWSTSIRKSLQYYFLVAPLLRNAATPVPDTKYRIRNTGY